MPSELLADWFAVQIEEARAEGMKSLRPAFLLEDAERILAALRRTPVEAVPDDVVERVARAITPAVLKYIPDYDEVLPDHVWSRPRYEWLTFAMVQIARQALEQINTPSNVGDNNE